MPKQKNQNNFDELPCHVSYSKVPPLRNSTSQHNLFHFLSEDIFKKIRLYISTCKKLLNITENCHENAVSSF